MKKHLHLYIPLMVSLLLISDISSAAILDVFKDEHGNTKWQYIANFTGSVFILLLSISLISLTVSQFKLRARNKELKEIRNNLEKTVQKRTETLQETNDKLESEIERHKATSAQLLSSQNYLESILASMPSMLIGLNKDLEITHWNRTAELVTGLNTEKVLGRYLWDAHPEITIAPEQIQTVLDEGQFKEIKHSQRGQYYFDITIYPLTEAQSGVVVIIENVTQRSLAEKMLIQRDKMASVGELASTMAHDLDIPLKGMLDNVQTVQKQFESIEPLPDNTMLLLRDTIERGQQASAVINNLLDFSKSQGKEKHIEKVTDILDHCIDLGFYVLSEADDLHFKDVVIEKNYSDDIPQIECYSAELQQVFLSLFRHACRSMAAKLTDQHTQTNYQPKLTLEVLNAYDNVWVKVQHNGQGLSAEEQQDLFEPIVQHTTHSNPKPVIPENRLSFPFFIVTEHHQGQMAVTSAPDVGTTFHIQFLKDIS